MTKVIAFDVNETLLDLSALDAPFAEALGDSALRPQWFALMVQLAFVGGLTGDYVDFSTAQHAAFLMLAERNGIRVTADDAAQMVRRMSSLPAHPDVPTALEELAPSAFSVVALTNSPRSVVEAQLDRAGIRGSFDRVFSADSVKRLKPAREPYLAVAQAYGTEPADVRLVAAHSWDVAGALSAGCKAAFVARPGMVLSPIGRQPDIVEKDVAAVVRRLLAATGSA
jgi:2-haloacid dehalogenase